MELTGVRRQIDDLVGKLPRSTRRGLKLWYQRGAARAPVELRDGAVGGRYTRRRSSTTLPLVHAGPLPSLPWLPPPISPAHAAGDAHACLVAAGDLDPRLEQLLACERTGTPIVCLATTSPELSSEIAGIASALLVPSVTLATQAASVLPEERIVGAPTILPQLPIPAAGLTGSADRDSLLVLYPDAASVLGDAVPAHLQLHQVEVSSDVGHLIALASTALAVLVTETTAGADVAAATLLAACGVPVLGPIAASHPLHGLVTAAELTVATTASPSAAIARLAADPALRRACGVRVRRDALSTSSQGAVLRRLLPALEQPVTEERVAAVTRVSRGTTMLHVLANLRRIRGLAARIVVTDDALPLDGITGFPEGIEVVPAGRALRRALRHHEATHVAMLDERCWYGPDHVIDLLLAEQMGGAAITGHGRHHRIVARDGSVEVAAGAEEQPADRLQPGSTLLPIGLALPRLRDGSPQEERTIVERAHRRGAGLYAIHRFGFLCRDDEQVGIGAVPWENVFPDGDGGIPFGDAK